MGQFQGFKSPLMKDYVPLKPIFKSKSFLLPIV